MIIKYDILQTDGLGGAIHSPDELYAYVTSLKKANRHLVTNFYMSEEEINRYTKEEQLYYKFKKNSYLNIWVYEHDFARLFFCIADVSSYEVPDVRQKLICDLFFQNEKSIVGIVDRLKCLNFCEYAFYTKWIKKEAVLLYECNEEIIRIESGTAKGFYELLRQCFDIYSDLVPEEKDAIAFLNGKKCYTAFHQNTGEVIGGIVISVHGNIQTEEFIFVRPDMRGQKIAKCLHKRWYDEANDAGIQYLAWIRDDNYDSICLHSQIGYTKHNSNKLTMIREKQ